MWLFFTLATTLLWGVAELFYKKGSHENEKYGHLKVCVLVGAVMGIHAIFTLLTADISYDPRNLIAYLPVSLCYILSMACSFFGMKYLSTNVAIMTFTVMVGSLIAMVSNKVLELTGGYPATFLMLLALTFAALVLNVMIKKP